MNDINLYEKIPVRKTAFPYSLYTATLEKALFPTGTSILR